MLEWHGWEVDRAVSAFMLGDITPPRSYLANPAGGGGGASSTSSPGFSGGGMMSAGADSSGFGGLGGSPAGGERDAQHGGRSEPRAPPGVLSVIVGLPFRLLGKVWLYSRR